MTHRNTNEEKNVSSIHRAFYNLKGITKYGIVGLAVLCTLHSTLLFFGKDLFIIHLLLCLFAVILGITLSRMYGLCWAHRLCVIYICWILISIVLRKYRLYTAMGFDIHLVRGVMALSGIIILGVTLYRTFGKKPCC